MNETQERIQDLQKAREILLEVSGFEREIRELEKEQAAYQKKLERRIPLYALLGTVLLILVSIGILFVMIQLQRAFAGYLTMAFPYGLLFLVYLVLQGWLIKAFFNPARLVINSYHSPKLKFSNYDQKIAWYEEQQRDTLWHHEIDLSQVVSEKYWSLRAVNHFLASLENGRAANLTEAIQLYELENLRQRQKEERERALIFS